MKLERLISIIYKLLNCDVLSAATLAEEYQVSPRTIYRDIEAICAAGFPVVSYQGMKGGYGMMDGYKMDKSLLGSYDVESLITVLQSLSTVFEDERAQGTIERLQTIGPEHRTSSLTVDLETRRMAPDALRRLRAAIAGRQVVRFDYVDVRSERTTRELEPLRLEFKYLNWYVYGYCRTRRDYREFRVARMLNPTVTERTFQPHSEAKAYAAGFGGEREKPRKSEKPEEVALRARPGSLAEVLDHFPQADRAFHADGGMTVRLAVDRPLESQWLRSILLSFGGGVEVLEPPALRTMVREHLRQALRLYEEV